jgi:hypothetical protein
VHFLIFPKANIKKLNHLKTEGVLRRGADKSLAFPISPTGGLQHNKNNFSWMC